MTNDCNRDTYIEFASQPILYTQLNELIKTTSIGGAFLYTQSTEVLPHEL